MYSKSVLYVNNVERVSGASDEGDRGELLNGVVEFPGQYHSAGGGHTEHEGRDGKTSAWVSGSAQRQDGPGHRDRHLQETSGGGGEQVNTFSTLVLGSFIEMLPFHVIMFYKIMLLFILLDVEFQPLFQTSPPSVWEVRHQVTNAHHNETYTNVFVIEDNLVFWQKQCLSPSLLLKIHLLRKFSLRPLRPEMDRYVFDSPQYFTQSYDY